MIQFKIALIYILHGKLIAFRLKEGKDLENFVIKGGKELFGEVNISGAKNAAVAIIPAALLADDKVKIENIPNISDVSLIIEILNQMGAA